MCKLKFKKLIFNIFLRLINRNSSLIVGNNNKILIDYKYKITQYYVQSINSYFDSCIAH